MGSKVIKYKLILICGCVYVIIIGDSYIGINYKKAFVKNKTSLNDFNIVFEFFVFWYPMQMTFWFQETFDLDWFYNKVLQQAFQNLKIWI